MKTIIFRFKKKYGYEPTIFEIANLYRSGCLDVKIFEENDLIKELSKNNLI